MTTTSLASAVRRGIAVVPPEEAIFVLQDEAQYVDGMEMLLAPGLRHPQGLHVQIFDKQQMPPHKIEEYRENAMGDLINAFMGGPWALQEEEAAPLHEVLDLWRRACREASPHQEIDT